VSGRSAPKRTAPGSVVVLPPDEASQRRIRRSRVLSYALVVLAAVVLSLRPEVLGDPQAQPWHALLHVWRIVLGLVLALAALAVQIVVGVQWRKGLSAVEDDELPTGRAAPGDGAAHPR
jgi:hypothetical protein